MILEGLHGKIARFVFGRYAAIQERGSHGKIPDSCPYYFPVEKTGGGGPLTILFSGDGGWANLTGHLAKRFQAEGLPVVGIDTMQYFWKEKSPEEAARALAGLISTCLETWNAASINLVGYSMGADVLPVVARRLPENLRDRVNRMILMSPSYSVELRFRFIGWLGYSSPRDKGFPLLPDLEVLSAHFPIKCYAGTRETDSLATTLAPPVAEVTLLPGGHHYGNDYETLANEILSEIRKDA